MGKTGDVRDETVPGKGMMRVPRPDVKNSFTRRMNQSKGSRLAKGTCDGVMTHLGQQEAQLSLSLEAPQASSVGAGHIDHEVVSQGAQDTNALYIVCSSIHRSLILSQVYSQGQTICEEQVSQATF